MYLFSICCFYLKIWNAVVPLLSWHITSLGTKSKGTVLDGLLVFLRCFLCISYILRTIHSFSHRRDISTAMST